MKRYFLAVCFGLLAFVTLATKAQDYKEKVIGTWAVDDENYGKSTHVITADKWAITFNDGNKDITTHYNYKFTTDKDIHFSTGRPDDDADLKIVSFEGDVLVLYFSPIDGNLELVRVGE